MNIKDYGWNEFFEEELKKYSTEGLFPGRIIADYGQIVRVVTDDGELQVSRPISKYKESMLMAVGDWVALQYSEETSVHQIRSVLTRKTKFSRTAAGIKSSKKSNG